MVKEWVWWEYGSVCGELGVLPAVVKEMQCRWLAWRGRMVFADVHLRGDVLKQERTEAAEVVSCFRLSKGNKSVSIEIRNQGSGASWLGELIWSPYARELLAGKPGWLCSVSLTATQSNEKDYAVRRD